MILEFLSCLSPFYIVKNCVLKENDVHERVVFEGGE